MFHIGEQVVWSRINWDKSAVESRKQETKTLVTESFQATVIEIGEKRYLLEFKNKIRKWILKRNALLVKAVD